MQFGVKIGAEDFDSSQVKSRVNIQFGSQSSPHFSTLHDHNVGTPSVSFVFHGVKDQAALKESLETTSSTMKEILLDLGKDFEDSVNQVKFNVNEKDD